MEKEENIDLEKKEETKQEENKTEKKPFIEKKDILDFVFAIAITWFILTVFIINIVVPTESMYPVISPNDRLIGNRLAYKFDKEPQRNDVVVFVFPDDQKTYFIKRIIGLPGETVDIIPDDFSSPEGTYAHVYINGEKLEEVPTVFPIRENKKFHFEVPEDSYFMMGDNRNFSWDARYWDNHFVTKDKIIAKAVFKYWKGFEKIK